MSNSREFFNKHAYLRRHNNGFAAVLLSILEQSLRHLVPGRQVAVGHIGGVDHRLQSQQHQRSDRLDLLRGESCTTRWLAREK